MSNMFNATTVFELREFNKKNKKNSMDKQCKIVLAVTWTESEILDAQFSFHMLCTLESLKVN